METVRTSLIIDLTAADIDWSWLIARSWIHAYSRSDNQSIAGARQLNYGATRALVEFSDYQCPFCGKFAREALDRIQTDFVKPGKIAFIFLNLPLERIHPFAFRAAEAAECAGASGRYWDMHSTLFAHQRALSEERLIDYAEQLGIERSTFMSCLARGSSDAIHRQMAEATRLGVISTPTFFLAEFEAGGIIHLRRRWAGASSYESLRVALHQFLISTATIN